MLEDTNEVTTLEEEQNIETELEETESIEVEESSEDTEEFTEKEDVDFDNMNDDEFAQYMNSNKQDEVNKSEKSERVPEVPKENIPSKSTINNAEKKIVEKEEKTSTDNIDYKSAYEDLFKPFKANGKDIAPKTVEDIKSLMQMGANYTKKMQAIAPIRRTAETLNKADIKDDDLNFLIDIHKGDKEAIKQLLSKHKIDPMDLDLDSTNYKPKDHRVSDEDVEFSSILEDIQPSLPKINDILSNVWDSKSKQTILRDPNLMKALHEEISLGRFDEMQNRLELEKTFGRFKGKSDLDAYIELLPKFIEEKVKANKETPVRSTNTPKKSIPDKSKAAPTRTIPSTGKTTITSKDIFDMSDEDFKKLNLSSLV
jgi:hypothetical protein